MAGIGGSNNDAFAAGVDHLTNAGRANSGSITLGMADQGLDVTSARWDSLSPRGVLNTAMGAGSPDDGSWERVERGAGGYAPGSMETFQDQLTDGSDGQG